MRYEGRDEYSFILFYTVIIEQGTKRVTYRASDYNVPPLLTDRTGQQSCFFRSARSRSYNMIYENIKYFQKFVKKCFKKSMFLPQNKGHISNKSQTFAVYGCVSSYDTTSYVAQT